MTIRFTRDYQGYSNGSEVSTLSTAQEDAIIAAGAATRTLGSQQLAVFPSASAGNAKPANNPVVLSSDGTSLVSADGNVLLVIPAVGSPSDLLTTPLQHVNITAAISTTATAAAAATGTYYKARIAWNNNGASGSAKLRIAVNCDNDVHGLMVGQSSKRRDYEMTMGDAVILVCSVPITRLTFSADGSITGGTHQLQVTFGN